MRETLGNLDRAVMSDDELESAEFDIRMIEVGAQPLRVAVKRGPKGRPPSCYSTASAPTSSWRGRSCAL